MVANTISVGFRAFTLIISIKPPKLQ